MTPFDVGRVEVDAIASGSVRRIEPRERNGGVSCSGTAIETLVRAAGEFGDCRAIRLFDPCAREVRKAIRQSLALLDLNAPDAAQSGCGRAE